MSVSVSIIPFSESLDLYGEPDRHAAYSLSGFIKVSLSSASSIFERRRSASAILQSLIVTFEGQSELVSEDTGYSAFRLCSVTQELVDGEPIEMDNDGYEDSHEPCTWNIVFNLTVPGWLPETSAFGDRDGGTRYGLHAIAIVQDADSGATSSWLSAFCAPFRSTTHLVRAPKVPIQLNRFMSPPQTSALPASSSTSLWPLSHYSLGPGSENTEEETDFPADVLSKLRVQISIPERVGTDEGSIPFTMRVRTGGLTESQCKRLRVPEFEIEIEQSECYRTLPLAAYTSQFPVPSRAEQPPHLPLLDPHPVQQLYNLGLATSQPTYHAFSKTFSLLPPDSSGRYRIAGDGYAFSQDTEEANGNSWFTLQTSVPFSQNHSNKVEHESWKQRRVLRPSGSSPFLGVSHRMFVTLTCTYDLSEEEQPERATEQIRFHMPIRFSRALPDSHLDSRPTSPILVGHMYPTSEFPGATTSIPSLPSRSSPYANTLPAYSQLFDSNGDRKIDYSIPLPLYTAHPSDMDLVVLNKNTPSFSCDSTASS